MWFGLGSLLCAPVGPVALLYGIKAISDINSSGGTLKGAGKAWVGMILGGLTTLILLVVLAGG